MRSKLQSLFTRRRVQAAAGFVLFTVGSLLVFAGPREPAASAEGDARDRLARLSTPEKEELTGRRRRFEQLDVAEQQRMRDLHRQINHSEDREQLLEVMHRYYG